ncbi:MAG: MFS transporter [Ilumatobacteraceae bacterium]
MQPPPDTADWAPLQRRTIATLRLAQVPGQAAVAGVVAVVTLLAGDLLGERHIRFAGVGSAAFTLGSAFLAVPLTAFMRRRGRRPGLMVAFGLGSVGAALAGIGGQSRLFVLFLVGMVLFGGAQAATLQGRYVAADLAPDHGKATAIAAIVWVGTLGAVFGPILTPYEKRVGLALGLDEFVGPFFFASVLLLVSMSVAWARLRPDPLAVTGQLDPHARRTNPFRQVRVSARVIATSSRAPLGLAAMVVSQAAMVAVMTMTPPHMKDHGHSDLSAYVIALHICGMYGLAPLVGRLVARIGAVRAVMAGSVVLGAGTALTVLGGYVPALVFVGLFLLGLGWNIGLISGSSILTSAVPAGARVEVQGTADLTMSFCGGIAAFSSGFIKAAWGFHLLADSATVVAGLLLVAAYAASLRMRATATVG